MDSIRSISFKALLFSFFAMLPLAAQERLDQPAVATVNIDGNDIHLYPGNEAGTVVYIPAWCFKRDEEGKVAIWTESLPASSKQKVSMMLIKYPYDSYQMASRIAAVLNQKGIMPEIRPEQVISARVRRLKIEDITIEIRRSQQFETYETVDQSDLLVLFSLVMESNEVENYKKFVRNGGVRFQVTQRVVANSPVFERKEMETRSEMTSAPAGWRVLDISVDVYSERAKEYLEWWKSPNKLDRIRPEPSGSFQTLLGDRYPVPFNTSVMLYDLRRLADKEKKPADSIYNVTVFLTDPANRSVFHTFNVCGMPPGRVETFGGLEFFMVGSKLYANVMPSDLNGKNTPLNNVEGAEQSASGGASK